MNVCQQTVDIGHASVFEIPIVIISVITEPLPIKIQKYLIEFTEVRSLIVFIKIKNPRTTSDIAFFVVLKYWLIGHWFGIGGFNMILHLFRRGK